MKKITTMVLLVVFLISCGQREADIAQIQRRNGIAYAVNEESPFSGKVTGLFPNGQRSHEENFINGKTDGLAREWYENGQLRIEGAFVNGEQDGVSRLWYENGQL